MFTRSDAAFVKAAAWKIRLQPETMKKLSNLFLQIGYAGDVARLNVGKELQLHRAMALADERVAQGRLPHELSCSHPRKVGLSQKPRCCAAEEC